MNKKNSSTNQFALEKHATLTLTNVLFDDLFTAIDLSDFPFLKSISWTY